MTPRRGFMGICEALTLLQSRNDIARHPAHERPAAPLSAAAPNLQRAGRAAAGLRLRAAGAPGARPAGAGAAARPRPTRCCCLPAGEAASPVGAALALDSSLPKRARSFPPTLWGLRLPRLVPQVTGYCGAQDSIVRRPLLEFLLFTALQSTVLTCLAGGARCQRCEAGPGEQPHRWAGSELALRAQAGRGACMQRASAGCVHRPAVALATVPHPPAHPRPRRRPLGPPFGRAPPAAAATRASARWCGCWCGTACAPTAPSVRSARPCCACTRRTRSGPSEAWCRPSWMPRLRPAAAAAAAGRLPAAAPSRQPALGRQPAAAAAPAMRRPAAVGGAPPLRQCPQHSSRPTRPTPPLGRPTSAPPQAAEPHVAFAAAAAAAACATAAWPAAMRTGRRTAPSAGGCRRCSSRSSRHSQRRCRRAELRGCGPSGYGPSGYGPSGAHSTTARCACACKTGSAACSARASKAKVPQLIESKIT